jgi:hypothetical protein
MSNIELQQVAMALIVGASRVGIERPASIIMQARHDAHEAGKSRREGYEDAICKLSALLLDRAA